MAKDKADKEKKREKKEKKRSETDGVHKSKKDKKKSVLSNAVEKELTDKVLEGLEKADAKEVVVNGDVEATPAEQKEVKSRPVGALVPFANPLVEDKTAKKVLKTVKKGKVFAAFQFETTTDLRVLSGVGFLPELAGFTCHMSSKSLHRILADILNYSRREQIPQTRCQGSCQGPPEVACPSCEHRSLFAGWRRHPRR